MSLTLIEEGGEFPAADQPVAPTVAGYLVVIEAGEEGWGAYVPDLPGVVAAAPTAVEARTLIAEAVGLHLEGLLEGGEPIPQPVSTGHWVSR